VSKRPNGGSGETGGPRVRNLRRTPRGVKGGQINNIARASSPLRAGMLCSRTGAANNLAGRLCPRVQGGRPLHRRAGRDHRRQIRAEAISGAPAATKSVSSRNRDIATHVSSRVGRIDGPAGSPAAGCLPARGGRRPFIEYSITVRAVDGGGPSSIWADLDQDGLRRCDGEWSRGSDNATTAGTPTWGVRQGP